MLPKRVLSVGLSALAGAMLLAVAPANAEGSVGSTAPATGCTLTQGWYATHPTQWPYGPDQSSSGFFSSGQSALQVLLASSKAGVYYQLAQQVIAAQLNAQWGASMPADVQAAQDQAFEFFSTATPATPLTKAQETQLKALIPILTAYNEGAAVGGPQHCTSVPTTPYLPGGLYS